MLTKAGNRVKRNEKKEKIKIFHCPSADLNGEQTKEPMYIKKAGNF
jgi:hypothetical protein